MTGFYDDYPLETEAARRLVEFHREHYGAQPEDELILASVEPRLTDAERLEILAEGVRDALDRLPQNEQTKDARQRLCEAMRTIG